MPSGIPVATVAINGGQNAGILAAKMLAMSDPELLEKLKVYKEGMKEKVVAKAEKLEKVARRLLEKVMEHTDREFWYAATGCLCAYWDNVNGFGLCFIPERARFDKDEV